MKSIHCKFNISEFIKIYLIHIFFPISFTWAYFTLGLKILKMKKSEEISHSSHLSLIIHIGPQELRKHSLISVAVGDIFAV